MIKISRLKYGKGLAMTPEEKKARKRLLQKRWRHNHPQYIKKQNKYWSELYSKTKPFECVCKVCGNSFYGARSSLLVCPVCAKAKAQRVANKRKAELDKRNAKIARNAQALELHAKGLKQQQIGDILSVSQRVVSYILRKNGIITQVKQKRKKHED